jgi:hypothetical protein
VPYGWATNATALSEDKEVVVELHSVWVNGGKG